MKKLRTLYLIAAEGGYRLLLTHDTAANVTDFVEIAHKTSADFSDVAFSYASEQSRNHGGPGAPAFDTGGSANRVEQERIRFSRHIVAALEAEWATGTHDRIVIAAGPKMLGQLRDELPKALHSHVTAELHKDLIKIPPHELASHFATAAEG